MVPLIYNFTFTRVYMHGIMWYLKRKNSWFAMENFNFTKQVVAFPRYMTFLQDLGFPYNKS